MNPIRGLSWRVAPIFLALVACAPVVADGHAPGDAPGYVVQSGDGVVTWAPLADGSESYVISVGNNQGLTVDHSDRAFLGVSLEEETEYAEGGARIVRVIEDSPAAEAGFEKADIIVGFDGHPVRGPRGLTQRIHDKQPGDAVSIEIVRGGREQTIEVELGERSLGALMKLREMPHLRSFSWGGIHGKPRLGVQLVETTPELREHLGGSEDAGVLVTKVIAGTPAEDAGIQVGDLIVSVDGVEIDSTSRLIHEVHDKADGCEIEVVRGGRSQRLDVRFPDLERSRPTGPRARDEQRIVPSRSDDLRRT